MRTKEAILNDLDHWRDKYRWALEAASEADKKIEALKIELKDLEKNS